MKKLIWKIFLLVLTLNLFAKPYKGAELRTKESYLYGRFEVRFKASAGSGQTSTFFTYNDLDPLERWNEIDIEILGRYEDDVQFNTITPRQGNNHVRHQYVDFNPCLDFHTYAIEWTPDYVAWFVDGTEVYRQDQEHIATLVRPQKIMMNIWNPVFANWVGAWDESILPRFAYYDYVSYSAYTPGTGNIGTGNNFTLQWIDNFDAFDPDRWEKATHTFPGNNCDFVPENIVYKDGNMILCLTDPGYTGYVDKKPPVVQWARAIGNQIVVGFSEELEQTSAETISNYRILGTKVRSATLQTNRKSVLIEVDSLDYSRDYNVVAMGISDDAEPANKLLGQVVKIALLEELEMPVKINVGGEAAAGYLGDQQWGETVMYGYLDGDNWDNPELTINNGMPAIVYQSHRNGIVAYKVRIPDGRYNVTLKMADYFFTEPGKRIFDVYVEGMKGVESLDLINEVGPKSAFEVTVENVDVSDQVLDIHFSAHADLAALSGLVIEPATPSKVSRRGALPGHFNLEGNYPNPFNPATTIRFTLAKKLPVTLAVYNNRGQLVETLIDEMVAEGEHQISWDGSNYTSGVYIVRMIAENRSENIKITLIK